MIPKLTREVLPPRLACESSTPASERRALTVITVSVIIASLAGLLGKLL